MSRLRWQCWPALLALAVFAHSVHPAVAAPRPKRGHVPQIYVVSRPWPALVSVRVVVGGGGLADPVGREGLAALGWSAALRGAGERERSQFNAALDAIGTQIGVSVDKLGATIYGDVAQEHLDAFVALLADAVLRPRFDPAEVDAVRAELLADLAHLQDDDEALAHESLTRYLFRGSALGRPTGGTPQSLQAISVADLKAWHAKQVGGNNLRLGLAGAVDKATAERVVHTYFGDLAAGSAARAVQVKADSSGRRLLLIDKPRRTQAQVAMALPTVAPGHKDMIALVVANAVLGGAFTSRLNREIRELRGWSYGTSSSLSAVPGVTTWSMTFAPNVKDATPAIDLATRILQELRQTGITPAELSFAKDFVIGAHRLALESADRELRQRMRAAELGLPEDEMDTFEQRVRAVDHRTIQRVLRERLTHDQLVAVVVGSAKALLDKLSAATSGFAVEVLGPGGVPENTAGKGNSWTERPAAELPEPPTETDDGQEGMEAEPEEP